MTMNAPFAPFANITTLPGGGSKSDPKHFDYWLEGFVPEFVITSKGGGQAYWIDGGVGMLNLQPYADHVDVTATSINQLFADDAWHTSVTAIDYIVSAHIMAANDFGLSSPWLSLLDFEGRNSNVDLGALWTGSVHGDRNNVDVDHLQQQLVVNGNSNDVEVGGPGDVIIFGAGNTITSFGWDGNRFTGVVDARGAEGTSVRLSDAGEYSDEAVVLGGDGADHFVFYRSDVTYNPGAGEDHVFVSGGRSFGNTSGDGNVDEVYFSSHEGGYHRLQADSHDRVIVDGFSAKALALVTTGTTNMVALANGFYLEVQTVD